MLCLFYCVSCIITLAAADLSIAVVSGTLKMRLGTAGYASSTLTTTTDHMDSTLNLNTLASSLPNSGFAKAEKDLLNNFKGIDIISLINPQPGSRQKERSFCVSQPPPSVSPPSTDPLDRHRNGLTMPDTQPPVRMSSP